MMFNPYEVLGVGNDADEWTIKLAYRAMAKATHPDGATPDEAKFIDVVKAYGILTNPELRQHFDDTGEIAAGELQERQVVMAELASFFRMSLSQLEASRMDIAKIDIIAVMRKSADEKLSEFEASVAGAEAALRHRLALLKRISRDDSNDNLFANVLNEEINAIRTALQSSKKTVRLLARCCDELEHYSSEVELINAFQSSMYGFARQRPTFWIDITRTTT